MIRIKSYLQRQFPHYSLANTEDTYSGLADGCAEAGRAGCKLIEFTGDGVSGDDVKNLINDAHDVIELLLKFLHRANFFYPSWLSSSTALDMMFLLFLAS